MLTKVEGCRREKKVLGVGDGDLPLQRGLVLGGANGRESKRLG